MALPRADSKVEEPQLPNIDSYAEDLEVDCLIVGAGFGGIYLLHKLRERGFSCKIYESGSDIGGVWHWNCYPGARVDSTVPVYELSIEKLWKGWSWSEKYPNWKGLRQYFEHVDEVLDIRRDVAFNSHVVHAQFDKPSRKWTIKTRDGRTARAKYLLIATGFAAKRHYPDWPGLDKYKGELHHSSFWPQQGIDVKGKKIAVVGTGSTGIQIAQECANDDAQVTVFQRTPNLCLPMRQRKLTKEEQEREKENYPAFYESRFTSFAGFQYDFADKETPDDANKREALYEELWKEGGFRFWLATYKDVLFDKKANRHAYDFWAKKTRARISNPVKRDILAPVEPPHFFGTKRPSLEQNFYEIMDLPQNEIVDVNKTPVMEVTETGIKTSDGKHREFDIIALATGFNAVTGGMKAMGLKDVEGRDLSDVWSRGTRTYLGMSCAGFPNMFFLYGPQAPTAFSNGPSTIEIQGDWVVDALEKLKAAGMDYIEPTPEAVEQWTAKVKELSDKTLFPLTKSWYMGANIPGKVVEQLSFPGGIPLYLKECREVSDRGFDGFIRA